MSKPSSRLLRIATAVALSCGAVIVADAQSRSGRDYSSRSTSATSRPTGYRDKYIILSDQNIFVRDRAQIRPDRESTGRFGNGEATTQFVRPAEMSYVLTGVVLEEGLYRAYIEDSNASRILRLTVGDAVARGHIVDIDINAIAYEASGQVKWVSLGCDLTGAPITSFASSDGSSGSSGRFDGGFPRGGNGNGGGPTSAPSIGVAAPPLPTDPNNPNLSLEEKMRLRRAQEIKK